MVSRGVQVSLGHKDFLVLLTTVVFRGVQESLGHKKNFVGFKTPRNTREVRGLSNLLKIRDVPLCLIFGTKNSKHQGTPGVFGSAVKS